MRVHPSQIILVALVIGVIVRGYIRKPRQTIGGVIGGVLGIGIPALIAAIYVWRGGDPTAAGALSFIPILTLPMGIALGVLVGHLTSKGRGTSGGDSDRR